MLPALGFQLVEEYLGRGVRGLTVAGSNIIRVAPTPYQPRREFTIGHELLELHLPALCVGQVREAACQRGAAALLLPAREFIDDWLRYRGQLPELRQHRPYASWEALASRSADLLPGVAAAAWVDDVMKWRRCYEGPLELTEAELEAVQRCRHQGRATVSACGVVALAWRLAGRGAHFRAVSLCLATG